mgnify:CR=1 FL=1
MKINERDETMSKHEVIINKEKCIGCQMCIKDCPAHNIEFKDKKAAIIDKECIMCGHCVAICPKNAVIISGYTDHPIIREKDVNLNPNDILNTIRFRRTIRQFQKKNIPQSVLEQIVEAGRLTHTAKNMQDISMIVLDKEKSRVERMAVQLFRRIKPFANLFSSMIKRTNITADFFFFEAPIAIVIASKDPINGALAAQNMEFVAEANGLGVLYSGFFSMAANHSRQIKRILELPKGKKVITTLVLGYPKVKYQRSVQREKSDIKFL